MCAVCMIVIEMYLNEYDVKDMNVRLNDDCLYYMEFLNETYADGMDLMNPEIKNIIKIIELKNIYMKWMSMSC
jgi:hypothetical protein